jgi:ATP-dependent Clp protease ATP-binding subunit ClpA
MPKLCSDLLPSILQQVINKELALMQKHLLKNGRRVNFKPEVVDVVIEHANAKIEYGAREVKSLVALYIQDPMAEYLLDNPEMLDLTVSAKTGKILVEGSAPKVIAKDTKAKTTKKTKVEEQVVVGKE